MKNKNQLIALVVTGIVLLGVIIFYLRSNIANGTVEPILSATGTPTSIWDALLESTPYAYFTPLPEPEKSLLDGIYTKLDPSWPQWWKCLRCADYRVAGGIWKLQFEQGVMRIYYEVTGWRSIASYKVEGDRLYLFNDPYCPENTGEYKWSIKNGELILETIDDPCSFDLREKNISKQAWLSCTDFADAPGCEEKRNYQADIIPADISVDVQIFGGDSRFFTTPPDVIVHANTADFSPPAGVEISYAQNTIAQGVHRILWWDDAGSWIEAKIDGSFEAIGVQFLGEQTIGWARVLFDGEEVWRGNTSAIWSKSGRHGGFINISGFDEGVHVIRVEALGFDYRPVTIASFGLSRDGNIQP
ncbi:MAG: hypothetical protein JNM46_03715 [Anaerolineales bacterium]|nr:hypothetical protein [Anaerolineales bacterium]